MNESSSNRLGLIVRDVVAVCLGKQHCDFRVKLQFTRPVVRKLQISKVNQPV